MYIACFYSIVYAAIEFPVYIFDLLKLETGYYWFVEVFTRYYWSNGDYV